VADFHPDETRTSARELSRHRKALRILVVVLMPLAIWTAFGLVALWPGDVSAHLSSDVSGYSVPGVSYPTARIVTVTKISCEGLAGSTPGAKAEVCANIGARLLEGAEKGQTVQVPLTADLFSAGTKVGQKIQLVRVPPVDKQPAQYQFSDFERQTPLVVLTLLFAVAVIVVARLRGLGSLFGLAFAGFILLEFTFPALISGTNPVAVGLIGSAAMMFGLLYAGHGFNVATSTALVGALFSLILIAGLGYAATRWAHLTGVSSEDDYVLSAAAPDLRLSSVVICGVIVVGVGVLSQITIRQATAVWELADADPNQIGLFSAAIRSRRELVSSAVYPIAFATVGAVLPVLLLSVIYRRPLLEVVQTEQFANEVIRTLAASIGLVVSVPLTTGVAIAIVRLSRRTGRAQGVSGPKPGDGRPLGSAKNQDKADLPEDEQPGQRRRRRRNRFDDFDDFSDLRDPPQGGKESGNWDVRSQRGPGRDANRSGAPPRNGSDES
jgi:uncharacterized membrane protein